MRKKGPSNGRFFFPGKLATGHWPLDTQELLNKQINKTSARSGAGRMHPPRVARQERARLAGKENG